MDKDTVILFDIMLRYVNEMLPLQEQLLERFQQMKAQLELLKDHQVKTKPDA